jgi:short-subunit dehydrogenase
MKSFAHRYGPWAVVTGASSGIGEQFARQLAARGRPLSGVARRRARLDALADELRRDHGVEAVSVVADLSAAEAVDSVVGATTGRDVGLLVNGAGFALTGDLLHHPLDAHFKLLDVNTRAPLMLAHRLGPGLLSRGCGGVINVASLAGFLPMPGWANYAASKAYLLSLSEALAHEWRARGVDVLALCPGATATEFANVAGIEHAGMAVEPVVAEALAALGRRDVVVTGGRNRLVAALTRLLPRRRRTAVGAKVVASMRPAA